MKNKIIIVCLLGCLGTILLIGIFNALSKKETTSVETYLESNNQESTFEQYTDVTDPPEVFVDTSEFTDRQEGWTYDESNTKTSAGRDVLYTYADEYIYVVDEVGYDKYDMITYEYLGYYTGETPSVTH